MVVVGATVVEVVVEVAAVVAGGAVDDVGSIVVEVVDNSDRSVEVIVGASSAATLVVAVNTVSAGT